MELHQILRYIPETTPIKLLDSTGLEIGNYLSKKDISVDLFSETILKISSEVYSYNFNMAYIVIYLLK